MVNAGILTKQTNRHKAKCFIKIHSTFLSVKVHRVFAFAKLCKQLLILNFDILCLYGLAKNIERILLQNDDSLRTFLRPVH